MFDLTGQVAIVTGGAMGIGRSVAGFLSGAGAKVAIADYNLEEAKKTAEEFCSEGKEVVAFKADVSDSEMVLDMINSVHKLWGRIDILVNNAGILQDKYITDISDDEWDKMLDIHVKGTFLCTRAVIPFMTEKNYGRIINISSLGSRQGIYLAGSHYCAGKGGVMAFSRQLAQQIYRKGLNITINCVAPGTIKTPLISKRSPEAIKWIIEQFPIHRLGTADDIGYAVLFLASQWAGYITGEMLDVNGGKYMM
ncbi:MAG: SDR family NAD(P)-dependent oxidoreductase [Lachnospiraceae bacterium]|nr:SDR family NAD(P)-dependent oxidoreductase [Lachnospiraceae bacterium]